MICLNCQKGKWGANTKKQSSAFGCLTVVVRKTGVKYEEKPINCWESGSIKGPSTNIMAWFCLACCWFCPYKDELSRKRPGERIKLCQGCVRGQGLRELCPVVALCWLTWGGGQRKKPSGGASIYLEFKFIYSSQPWLQCTHLNTSCLLETEGAVSICHTHIPVWIISVWTEINDISCSSKSQTNCVS